MQAVYMIDMVFGDNKIDSIHGYYLNTSATVGPPKSPPQYFFNNDDVVDVLNSCINEFDWINNDFDLSINYVDLNATQNIWSFVINSENDFSITYNAKDETEAKQISTANPK
jgi:hypothetical protein